MRLRSCSPYFFINFQKKKAHPKNKKISKLLVVAFSACRIRQRILLLCLLYGQCQRLCHRQLRVWRVLRLLYFYKENCIHLSAKKCERPIREARNIIFANCNTLLFCRIFNTGVPFCINGIVNHLHNNKI